MLKLKKIAITGQMGCGKSTVCQCFERYSSFIVSTDKLVEQLLISDKDCIQKVKSLLGEEVQVNGLIDKKKIASLVFSNRELLLNLEKILHPIVFKKMESLYQKCLKLNKYQFFVVEVPLLFEVGWEDFFDVTIYVTCNKNLAFTRLKNLGFSCDEYEARLSRFIPQDQAVKKADFVINNDATKKPLQEKVELIINNLRKNHLN
jgi:dephospho-CoA kinase